MKFFAPPYRRVKIWAASLTLFLITYSLIGFLLVPWLIQTQTPGLLHDNLHRKASLGPVSFNPFSLELRLNDFKLLEADGKTTFVAFKHLYFNYGLWQTIRQMSVAIQNIEIEQLYGHLDKRSAQQFNFTDLIPAETEKQPETESKPFPLWIGVSQLKNSRFLFEDHSLAEPYRKQIEHINLTLNNFKTLPDGETPYDLTLKLASGGSLRLQGNLTVAPLQSTGKITLTKLDLPPLWDYLQQNMALTQGKLSFQTQYQFASQDNSVTFHLQDSQINLADFQLHTRDAARLKIAVPSLVLNGLQLDLITQDNQQSITINNPDLTLSNLALTASGNVHYAIRGKTLHVRQINFEQSGSADKGKQNLSIEQTTLEHLSIADNRQTKPLIQLPETTLADTRLDLLTNKIHISSLTSDQAKIVGWLSKDGQFNLQALFTPTSPEPTKKSSPSQSAGKPLQLTIDSLKLNQYSLDIKDLSPAKPVHVVLSPLNLSITQFSTTTAQPFKLALTSGINNRGSFSSRGQVSLTPFKTQLTLSSQKIPLDIIQPYIDQFARLKIRRGDFFMDGKLNLTADKQLAGSFAGNINIRRLRTTDTVKGQDFLNWKQLAVSGIHYNLAPARLKINKVLTDRLYSRILVEKNKSTNIGQIFNVKKSTKPVKKAKSSHSQPLPIQINRIVVKNSASDFSDLSLVLPFTLKMDHLQGGVKNISSRKHQKANVKLAGKINQISNVSIAGNLNPFDIEEFMDIRLKTDSVNLTAITPYMAQFAGYTIKKGKVSLDLNYKIVNKKLQAENRIIIDQLTLGDEVESPDAVSLPLKLGIALLKDANGVIDLNLPLQGSLDDPQFSITSLIGKVLYNLLSKAVTSPFSLLGSLVGSDADLSHIEFQPGWAKLDASQQERLKTVSKALQERPELKLEIKGIALQQTDRLGLQQKQLNQLIKQRYWDDLDSDEQTTQPVDKISVTDAMLQQYLPEIYEQRFPDAEIPDTITTKDGKEQLPPDFMKAARQKLLRSFAVSNLQLQQLAQQRATAIARYLIDQTGLPQQRIFILEASIEADPETGIQKLVKVPLSLTTQ